MPHLFCFGYGYCAQALAKQLLPQGWTISGTGRLPYNLAQMRLEGVTAWEFGGRAPLPREALDGVTHLLISIPPDEAGDPVLRSGAKQLAERARQFAWVGYLSTTGVYGDRGGEWVDEDSALEPSTARGHRRLDAEKAWLALHERHGLPVHLFRLAGIYGPGRNQLESIKDGTARRIVRPGQVFSRIHVEDIAGVLQASIKAPSPGRAYNVCDDEPCPPQEVIAYAAKLLGREPPPEIPFEEANLSPMARSFYAESKRVSNRRIKQELGYRLIYPTYREGLGSLVAA
ncbi:MAG: SDR family oxidoreductase [Parvibaculaceae bacterium]